VYQIKKTIISLLCLTCLTACNDDEVKLAEACEAVRGLCEEIVSDSACKNERNSVILNEYDIRVRRNRSKIYQQMLALEDLKECTYKQSLIQYVPAEMKFPIETRETQERINKRNEYRRSIAERKRMKVDNYHNTLNKIERYNQETAGFLTPHLLYWHWSRLHDKVALGHLIELDEEGRLSGYDMMFFMSMAYASIDPEKVEPTLLRSLEQYPPIRYTEMAPPKEPTRYNPYIDEEGRLHYSIFRHLTQLYFSKKEYDKSYIFARLLEMNNDEAVDDFVILGYMKNQRRERLGELDQISETIDSWVKDGKFRTLKYEKLVDSLS